MKKILSLVLYICSDKPEVEFANKEIQLSDIKRPEEKYTKKNGLTIFPADKCKNYILGLKTGNPIKTAMLQTKEQSPKRSSGKKSHIRRGHWHGYWTGPKNQQQIFSYKWLYPMVIEGNKDTD